MAQIARATTGMTTVATAALQSLIDTLQSTMIATGSVTAADVNQLISAYNTWIQHTHNATDLRGQDTFGNLPVYGAGGTYAATKVSSASKTDVVYPGAVLFSNQAFLVVIADDIVDTDVNTIINTINAIRNHVHTIIDSIS